MRFFIVTSLLLLLGVGCVEVPFLVPNAEASRVELKMGSSVVLTEKVVGLPVLPGNKKGIETVVIIDEIERTDTTTLSWHREEQRETEASLQAKQEALQRIAQGEDIVKPETVYENVTVTGTVKSEGLDDAHRILLPTLWPEDDGKPVVQKSSVLWLSTGQYQELLDNGETEIQLSAVDAGLQDVVDLAAVAQQHLQKLTGGGGGATGDGPNLTKATLTGATEFILTYNDKKIQVPAVMVENGLATYTVLADPENPLILEVNLKAWSYGAEVLEALSIDTELAGYKVTSITTK